MLRHTPPKILLRLGWLEAALHGPLGIVRGKRGRSMRQYFEGLVGPRNYARIFGPFFAAVPSQCADAFPAGMLFKTRDTRRQDFPRSFTLAGGLQTAAEALAATPNVTVATGRATTSVAAAGDGWGVTSSDGERPRRSSPPRRPSWPARPRR